MFAYLRQILLIFVFSIDDTWRVIAGRGGRGGRHRFVLQACILSRLSRVVLSIAQIHFRFMWDAHRFLRLVQCASASASACFYRIVDIFFSSSYGNVPPVHVLNFFIYSVSCKQLHFSQNQMSAIVYFSWIKLQELQFAKLPNIWETQCSMYMYAKYFVYLSNAYRLHELITTEGPRVV